MSGYISRADAIEAVAGLVASEYVVKDGEHGFYTCASVAQNVLSALPSADAEPKRVLQGYNKGANTIQTIRHEELTQIANTRKAVESADAVPKMEHDREWIIGCIKHDGFIKTDRFDKANQIILDALSAEPSGDLISRANAIRWVKTECNPYGKPTLEFESGKKVIEHLKQMPSTEPKMKWIPCSERLPEARESVILSTKEWTGEGCYWETTKQHVIWKGYRWNATYWDDEVIAWMPLPKPYEGRAE